MVKINGLKSVKLLLFFSLKWEWREKKKSILYSPRHWLCIVLAAKEQALWWCFQCNVRPRPGLRIVQVMALKVNTSFSFCTSHLLILVLYCARSLPFSLETRIVKTLPAFTCSKSFSLFLLLLYLPTIFSKVYILKVHK